MHKSSVVIIGVPIDNLNFTEMVQKILALVNMHEQGAPTDYISTVNVDFLVNANAIDWNSIRYPELMNIYRNSALATADGMPLIWLSRLLGTPLKERVTGADIVPQLTALLALQKKSIYLLGATEHVNKVAAVILDALYPGIKIAGKSSPYIFITGQDLENAAERDALLIEEINQAKPDVLFIALGNPKQEIWFSRVRKRLNVPVAIGIGQSLDLLVGNVSRAPVWMRNIGLEWFYRLCQEPRRLWTRYLVGGLKLLAIAFPLIIYHYFNRVRFALCPLSTNSHEFPEPLLFLSEKQSFSLVSLPPLIDDIFSHKVNTYLERAFNQEILVLDFQNVKHVTLEGLSHLLRIWMRSGKGSQELYAINMAANVRTLFKMHRIWDVLKNNVLQDTEQLLNMLTQKGDQPKFFESLQQHRDVVTLSFFGEMGTDQNTQSYLTKLTPVISGKNCILDFSYCTNITNGGFGFLLRLQAIIAQNKQKLRMKGISKKLKTLFAINKIEL